jgi:hypothetical protein
MRTIPQKQLDATYRTGAQIDAAWRRIHKLGPHAPEERLALLAALEAARAAATLLAIAIREREEAYKETPQ